MSRQSHSQITGRHDPQIDSSKNCILRVDRDCIDRIPRAYAIEMTLPLTTLSTPSNRKKGADRRSNHLILRVNRDYIAKIPHAYAIEMAWPLPRPQAGWPNAARREQREDGREKKAASSIHCIFTVSRDDIKKVMKIRNGHPQIFTA